MHSTPSLPAVVCETGRYHPESATKILAAACLLSQEKPAHQVSRRDTKVTYEALFNTMNVYAAAIHQWQRSKLGVSTELEYIVLNHEAHKAWKNDEKEFDLFQLVESMDDFRVRVPS